MTRPSASAMPTAWQAVLEVEGGLRAATGGHGDDWARARREAALDYSPGLKLISA